MESIKSNGATFVIKGNIYWNLKFELSLFLNTRNRIKITYYFDPAYAQ